MSYFDLIDDHDEPVGDPRRCPYHPHVVTSSSDGLHDAPCYVCESGVEDEQVTPVQVPGDCFKAPEAVDEAYWEALNKDDIPF